ncbi:MAG: protein rep, partial [Dethiobacter sp.]|nr:protein rep [Dethiobacter sp.]MBS3902266.1 protein rep [Dethiobacter sp.]MBS3989183.1 protein rep [Dethiobacter sp.]
MPKKIAAVGTAANLINLDIIIPQNIPASQVPNSKSEPIGSHIASPPVLDNSRITSHRPQIQADVIERAHILWDCAGTNTITLYCLDNGHPRTVQLQCASRVCITCRPIAHKKLLARWMPRMQQLDASKLVLITLTRKTTPGYALRERIIETRKACAKLLRQQAVAACLQGGIYTVEVKPSLRGEGWNVHIHLLAEITTGAYRRAWASKSAKHDRCDIYAPGGHKLSVQSLAIAWGKLTGDSYIVDISPVRHGDKNQAMYYVAKYMAKPPQSLDPDKAPDAVLLYNAATRGLRLVQGWGTWHDTHTHYRFAKEPKRNPRVACEYCGCTSWISEYTLRRYPYLWDYTTRVRRI